MGRGWKHKSENLSLTNDALSSELERCGSEENNLHGGDQLQSLIDIQNRIDLFQSSIDRIISSKSMSTLEVWHNLLAWIARDGFHIKARCRYASWARISEKLKILNNILGDENKRRQIKLSVFSDHLRACLTPTVTISRIGKKTRLPDSATFSVSSDYLLKNRIIIGGLGIADKRLRNMRIEIQYSYWPQMMLNVNSSSKMQGKKETRDTSNDTKNNPVGIFQLKLYILGVYLDDCEVSMIDLLTALGLGKKTITLFSRIEFTLESFIALLIRKFYTKTRK